MIKILQHQLNYISIKSGATIHYFPIPVYISLTDHSDGEEEVDKAWFVNISEKFVDFVNENDDLKIYEITQPEYERLKSILDMVSTLRG